MHPQRTNIPLQGLDRHALTVGTISGPHSQIGGLGRMVPFHQDQSIIARGGSEHA